MLKHIALGGALVLLAAFSSIAHAGVQVTNTLEGAWNTDNDNGSTKGSPYDDNYGYIVDKLNLIGTEGDVSLWVRVDAWRYFKRPTVKYKGKILPERLHITYDLGDWKLTAGDFYKQFGRGLVLSFRKGDEVSADTAIRGAEVNYSNSGHKVTLFGGMRNQANLDPVTKLYFQEEQDILAGVQYHYNGFDLLNLGVHGLAYFPEVRKVESFTNAEGNNEEYMPKWEFLTSGGYIDAPDLTDWLAVYAEGNVQSRKQTPGLESLFGVTSLTEDDNQLGISAFASTNVFLGDFTFINEFLFLDNFDQGERVLGTDTRIQGGSRLHADKRPVGEKTLNTRAPTLVRLQDEIASYNHVTGASMALEYYIEDLELTLSVNGAYRLNGVDRAVHEMLGYGAAQWSYQGGRSRLKVEAGYWDTRKDAELQKGKVFVYVDWAQSVAGKWSLQFITDTEYRLLQLSDNNYLRGSTYLTLLHSEWGDVTFELGHDLDQNNADGQEGEMQMFYAATVSAEIADGWKVRGTAGSQRGGLKCIAGVCRWFPPFSGGRLEVVTRF